MKIQIRDKKPYGSYSKENLQFLEDSVGLVFEAERFNINYYKIADTDFIVHLYSAMEILE